MGKAPRAAAVRFTEASEWLVTLESTTKGSCKSGQRGDITISYWGRYTMAQLVVRNLDDDVKAKLQQRARRHGWNTEEEVREILRNVVRDGPQKTEPLGKRLRALFGDIGLEEDIPEWCGQPAKPATF
jgi:antitoxin FitA